MGTLVELSHGIVNYNFISLLHFPSSPARPSSTTLLSLYACLQGSWTEIMSEWAKTVRCGRARLGGIPVAAICVETRTVELNIPADPANLDSEKKTVQQAGKLTV